MKRSDVVTRLAALAQESRLRIFRLLVEAGPDGVNASAIAGRLRLATATLSFHLGHLTRAGLVVSRQEGRYVFYSVNFAAVDDVIAYLAANCCRGKRECLPKTAAVCRDATARGSSACGPGCRSAEEPECGSVAGPE
ncbi:MAG: winged helix-turn-helix transcriptional regulator [Betaproteobacteria bacterium]|nr:winged helix-turn-helix transcriptional regulator [Betaproteobacteria bacterium]